MNLEAVKAAARPKLLAYAAAAADNAKGLLDDAELLAGTGRLARAYSLAVLALEEFGKVAGLLALAVMPEEDISARVPLKPMLEWHELKQVGGLLMIFVSMDSPGMAVKLAGMSHERTAQIMNTVKMLALDADRLKRRGLYVDMDRRGLIRGPSQITEAEVAGQLDRVRRVGSLASLLSDPDARVRLADPPPEAIEFSRALARAIAEAGHIRGSKEAGAVLMTAVTEFQEHMGVSGGSE